MGQIGANRKSNPIFIIVICKDAPKNIFFFTKWEKKLPPHTIKLTVQEKNE